MIRVSRIKFAPSAWFKEKWDTILIILALAYFAFRLFYFVSLNIDHYIPPDEVTHFGTSVLFSKYLFPPENSPESYQYPMVTHRPLLYYILMGKLLKLNIFQVSDLLFLRLINALLGFLTVLYAYKWVKLLTTNRISHILFVIMFTNTLMFTFLLTSVSYDNLTNLLAAMSLYYLFSFFDSRNPNSLLLFGSCVLAGSLTKITFLPLEIALIAVLVFHERKSLLTLYSKLYNLLYPLKAVRIILFTVFLFLLFFNIKLYIGNLINYQKIIPSCEQVLITEQCMKFRNYARDRIFDLYKSGKLTYNEAIAATSSIKHKGDRASTKFLINNIRYRANSHEPLKDRIHYAFIWSDLMLARIFGIMGHIVMWKSPHQLYPYILVLILFAVMLIRKWRLSDGKKYVNYTLFVALFYMVVLMQYVNYRLYIKFEMIDADIQGRYLFPVLAPFYGLIARYLICYFRKPVQVIILLVTAVIFIYGDFPFFLTHVTSKWFAITSP